MAVDKDTMINDKDRGSLFKVGLPAQRREPPSFSTSPQISTRLSFFLFPSLSSAMTEPMAQPVANHTSYREPPFFFHSILKVHIFYPFLSQTITFSQLCNV